MQAGFPLTHNLLPAQNNEATCALQAEINMLKG